MVSTLRCLPSNLQMEICAEISFLATLGFPVISDKTNGRCHVNRFLGIRVCFIELPVVAGGVINKERKCTILV